MEDIDFWSVERGCVPANEDSVNLALLEDIENMSRETDPASTNDQIPELPFEDLTLFHSLFPEAASQAACEDWTNSGSNRARRTNGHHRATNTLVQEGNEAANEYSTCPTSLYTTSTHEGVTPHRVFSDSIVSSSSNAESFSGIKDKGDDEALRYVSFSPLPDEAGSKTKQLGSHRLPSAASAKTFPNMLVSNVHQQSSSQANNASLRQLDISAPLDTSNAAGNIATSKCESFEASFLDESNDDDYAIDFCGAVPEINAAEVSFANQNDSSMIDSNSRGSVAEHDQYGFEMAMEKAGNASDLSEKLFSSDGDTLLSYAHDNEGRAVTPGLSAPVGLGIFVHAPRTCLPNGQKLSTDGGMRTKSTIVPDSKALRTNIHSLDHHTWRAQNYEKYGKPLNKLAIAGRFDAAPDFFGESSISPVDYDSPYMSYSSSSSTDDSYGSRMSQENQLRLRNRSISKIPLREIYSMMGLSHDHTKAKWREERIIAIAKAEGFDVGNQTWIRDTEEAKRTRIIDSIREQTKEFGYPPELIEAIVRRGTYARMQSKLRQKRRHSKRGNISHQITC